MTAKLYIRRNGAFGSSCDGTQDTGHHIAEDSGKFTVYSIHDPDTVIALDVPREVAEAAIAIDWRNDRVSQTEPCGGCGETNPLNRCLGCHHVF